MRQRSFVRGWPFWFAIALFLTIYFISPGQKSVPSISFSKFMDEVENGKVNEVLIKMDHSIAIVKTDNTTAVTHAPEYPNLVGFLRNHGVVIHVQKPEGQSWFWMLLFNFGPILLLVALWVFMMRPMTIGSDGGGGTIAFGKSRAKLLADDGHKVTFADVAGIDEAKEELREIIDFLCDPKKFSRLGGRIPKGALLIGLPGTGKTLLARAVAGEANVPFFFISGSDFVEMFVGVGASRVRDLFVQGKKNAPCIIFIDEIDGMAHSRGAGVGGGHNEYEQTLNQLLVEMDGFSANNGVIIMAATNRPDVLDKALLRPGRFDRRIIVPLPDVRGREEILCVHARGVLVSADVDLNALARATPGFAGADLANLINEAALHAAKMERNAITTDDLEKAKDRIIMGAAYRHRLMNDSEKRQVAYHEAGHALVACSSDDADPIYKVTIIPRGMSLGSTHQLPEGDRHIESKGRLLSRIAVLYGGRVAEELAFGRLGVSTGAQDDLAKATEIASQMVQEFGMSKIGPFALGNKRDYLASWGRAQADTPFSSEKTRLAVDKEIQDILEGQYREAKGILSKHHGLLVRVAEALLEKEEIDKKELDVIIKQHSLL